MARAAAVVARGAVAAPVEAPGSAHTAPVGAPVPPVAPPLRSAAATQPPSGGDGAPDGSPDAGRPGLRRAIRENRRLRLGVLVLASLILLGAIPAFFAVRVLSRDPVFDSLDALDVPGWAATETIDNVSGSRWCLQDCRLRERAATSQRSPEQTAPEYERALAAAGWERWEVTRCPEQPAPGRYTCWRRDELTLDLWVRPPTCVPPPIDGQPAIPPSPAPTPTAAPDCTGSLVTVKVRNAIDDARTRPQPSTDPSLTGEDPFPTFTDDPLGELVPSPS